MTGNALACSVTLFLRAENLEKHKQQLRRCAEVKTLSPVVVVRDASHRAKLAIRLLHILPEQGKNTIAEEISRLFLSALISPQTKQKIERFYDRCRSLRFVVGDRYVSFNYTKFAGEFDLDNTSWIGPIAEGDLFVMLEISASGQDLCAILSAMAGEVKISPIPIKINHARYRVSGGRRYNVSDRGRAVIAKGSTFEAMQELSALAQRRDIEELQSAQAEAQIETLAEYTRKLPPIKLARESAYA